VAGMVPLRLLLLRSLQARHSKLAPAGESLCGASALAQIEQI
jgi:uncharacterized membrane protein YadS